MVNLKITEDSDKILQNFMKLFEERKTTIHGDYSKFEEAVRLAKERAGILAKGTIIEEGAEGDFEDIDPEFDHMVANLVSFVSESSFIM
jgi:hypothetical protein